MQPPYQPPPYQPPPHQQSPFQPPPPPAWPPRPATPPPVQRDVSVLEGLSFSTSGGAGWNNILICALCYVSTQIVPIIGLIVMMGFFAEVHRRLVLRHPDPYLRFDFSDLGNYLSRGVAPFVMYLALTLPMVIFLVILAIVVFVGAAGAAGSSGGDEGLALLASFGVFGVIFFPLIVFWLALTNAAVTRGELMGDLSKAFNLGAIWSYAAKTWKRVLVTTIIMGIFGIGLMMLGILACIVGVFVTSTIGMIGGMHVRWQIYNEYLLEGGEPIELAPWETLPSELKKPAYGAPPPAPYGAPPPRY
jgi:hypothetical protein